MFAVMWWANLVFLVSVAGYDYLFSLRFRAIQSVKGLITNDLKFARIIIPMTIRLHVWMIPWAAPPILERRHFEEFFSRYSGSQKQAMQYLNVIWSVFTVILEVTVMFAWQKPKFPETLNALLSCPRLGSRWPRSPISLLHGGQPMKVVVVLEPRLRLMYWEFITSPECWKGVSLGLGHL
ncbi:hypothetical protein DFH94DRAFT_150932 [Russula ochroleuca]|uniref:Uncharacterized protein n=1 Tax=Russula ochroleuca TaxID=152965 RepID=A0A9P5MN76_9AGAM|nr:hypothetical protein DFH94DRAFT_150932 [Russula ochroleuca]